MADLSKVLGDVYGAGRPAASAVEAATAAPAAPDAPAAPRPELSGPAWADESRLDEAFANWNPGPGPEAPAAERALFVSSAPSVPLDDDLAAALSEALADAPVPTAIVPPVPAAPPEAPATVRPSQGAAWLADVVRPDERPARVRPDEAVPEAIAPAPESAPVVAMAEPEVDDAPIPSIPLPARAWQRADDDVLVGGATRDSSRRLSFSLKRG